MTIIKNINFEYINLTLPKLLDKSAPECKIN